MPYYPTFDVVFVHVPKTAGGAIVTALAPFKARERKTVLRRALTHLGLRQGARAAYIPKHATALQHRAILGCDVYDQAKSFAIVRDPYDRMTSEYEFIRQQAHHHQHQMMQGMTFEDFLRKREVTQRNMLTDRAGRIMVDHVFRYENLHAPLNAFLAQQGVPYQLPATGAINAAQKGAVQSYLSDEALALIGEKAAWDFDVLGYERRKVRAA